MTTQPDQQPDARPLRIVHRDDPASDAADRQGVPGGPSQGTAGPAVGQWDPPIPLTMHRSLPAFPVQVLPEWLANTATAVATETQTPVDLPACLVLAMLSTAAGGRAVVNVRGRWTEPINLFVVVAMPPGSRKSPVFSTLVRPLQVVEKALIEQSREDIAAAQLAHRLARTRADKAARAAEAAEASKAPDLAEIARTAALEAEAVTVPVQPRLFADDVTPETVATLMAQQGGRLAVLSAEGGIIGTLAGRYSSQPNYDVFLKGHAGDMLLVDRQSRGAERIDHATLTLGLAVQPVLLRELAKVPAARDKGLLGRILYSWPEDFVGRRQIDPPTAPNHLLDTYTDNLTTLTRTLAEWNDPAVLTLTPEADRLRHDLQAATEPRLAATGQWAHLRDWGSKWVGHVARIAGLLHLADHLRDGWTRNIEATTWQRAQAIGDYFATHAEAVFDHMGADPMLEDARALVGWIERTRQTVFTVRDAHRANPGQFPKAQNVLDALEVLEERNHLRQAKAAASPGPGRKPSPSYHVHPAYTLRWKDNT